MAEMGLPVRVETRTGDTPPGRRQRQKYSPPDILLTTPEQFALLLSSKDAKRFFENVQAVVLDELHAMHNSKRGDLLSLGLARLQELAPKHRRIGLSATVADPKPLQRYLMPQPMAGEALSALVIGKPGATDYMDGSWMGDNGAMPWVNEAWEKLEAAMANGSGSRQTSDAVRNDKPPPGPSPADAGRIANPSYEPAAASKVEVAVVQPDAPAVNGGKRWIKATVSEHPAGVDSKEMSAAVALIRITYVFRRVGRSCPASWVVSEMMWPSRKVTTRPA